MAFHSRKLSFTTPILVSFAGIFFSFLLIAVFITLTQRNDVLENYHEINHKFTHNLAVNYTESILRENDYILARAANFFSVDDRLEETINRDPGRGLQLLMQLQTLMPAVSSISLADTRGHYLRAPEVSAADANKRFDVRRSPWYVVQAEDSTFNRYTRVYMDNFTHQPTVTVYKPVITAGGRLKGSLAFHLDLAAMGYTLRHMAAPTQGEFFIVERDGRVVLHPNTGALFKRYVSDTLMEKMTSGEGHIYDPESREWYYYYSFTNPDWFVIYRVSDATLNNLTRHATTMVIWGFALAVFVIVLFGLYLRHASRTVLMNIIQAIKTGEVNRVPRLEAMLSKAIESSKAREQAYARQATHDALTGCKNRRAFDSDIAALMNDHQPFILALVDVDNFKFINDTWGHLTGDVVLRHIAHEGLKIFHPHNVALYRYGGEEFAVIFTASQMHEACPLLEAWRQRVAARSWREKGLQVTFSAGYGEWQFEPLENLLSSVDEALYTAKRQGKDRILSVTSR